MEKIRASRPSPGIVVAALALVAALAGTAVADTPATTSAINKQKVKKIATKQINKLAPTLSVASADTAGSADTATTADTAATATNAQSAVSAGTAATATNAESLGGLGSAAFQRRGHRVDATTSTQPSVAGLSAISIARTSATTITNLTDGVAGQMVTVAANSNVTIPDSAFFTLTGPWTGAPGDTLTLIFLEGGWLEASRSDN